MPEFIRNAKRLLDAEEIQDLISYLAKHPASGVLMAGTGGVRKLRWAREGVGKSSGVRVIYYFHSDRLPLYCSPSLGKMKRPTCQRQKPTHFPNWLSYLLKRRESDHEQSIQEH